MFNKVHCFFEQSGTFRDEFRSLGIAAEDYDIENRFGKTDNICDLFKEISQAAEGRSSVFDGISSDDLVFAFFPCVRFSVQANLMVKAAQSQMINQSPYKRLAYSRQVEFERSRLYGLLCDLVSVCLLLKIPLIIENPYAKHGYLSTTFPFEPSIIDMDRTKRGDYFPKPTQYFFFNLQPKCNLVFEARFIIKSKSVAGSHGFDRSMISPQYANRFIREFLLG